MNSSAALQEEEEANLQNTAEGSADDLLDATAWAPLHHGDGNDDDDDDDATATALALGFPFLTVARSFAPRLTAAKT